MGSSVLALYCGFVYESRYLTSTRILTINRDQAKKKDRSVNTIASQLSILAISRFYSFLVVRLNQHRISLALARI